MCWFAHVLGEDVIGPCDGPLDRCHLIPKQRIKREIGQADPALTKRAIWHPSSWVDGCRRHHGNFDNRIFRVSRAQLPQDVELYATVMGLGWSLDHDFGPR